MANAFGFFFSLLRSEFFSGASELLPTGKDKCVGKFSHAHASKAYRGSNSTRS